MLHRPFFAPRVALIPNEVLHTAVFALRERAGNYKYENLQTAKFT